MTSMKTKKKKKKIILFWKHMINRVFSRDFCSGMVLFTCRILIGNISRVTFTSSFQIVFPRPLWFHATECCVFRFKSVPTWWLCGPIGACAARLSPARIFVLLSSSLLMPSGEIYLRLKPYLVVKIASDVLTELCCQVCVLAMIFCRSDCRLCAWACKWLRNHGKLLDRQRTTCFDLLTLRQTNMGYEKYSLHLIFTFYLNRER